VRAQSIWRRSQGVLAACIVFQGKRLVWFGVGAWSRIYGLVASSEWLDVCAYAAQKDPSYITINTGYTKPRAGYIILYSIVLPQVRIACTGS
jgi:hypothetical protein